MNQVLFAHEEVASLPEMLQANILYVTTDRDVAGHLCACGCGREVITPLSPTDWRITFGGSGPSLHPSIGNWSFPCRSHYIIKSGSAIWAEDMSDNAVSQGRQRDKANKRRYYGRRKVPLAPLAPSTPELPQTTSPANGLSAGGKWLTWWKRMFFE